MALLIVTGEHQAIQLKGLHGSQVLQLDEALVELGKYNGGWGRWIIEIRGCVLQHIETLTKVSNNLMSVSLRPKRRQSTA